MEGVGLPFFGPSIEYSSVSSVEPKRILTFFNQFVSQSVNLLNKFAVVSDVKLEELNLRLQRVEATLSILEAKLSSVPVEAAAATILLPSSSELEPEISQTKPLPVVDAPVVRQTEQPVINPEIVRFSKMLQVGVPLMAVELKMRAEGLDPALLRSHQVSSSTAVRQDDTDSSESDASLSHQED